jgi:uncharacterized protein
MIVTKSVQLATGTVRVDEEKDGQGMFEGYAATYGNIDRDDDIMVKGSLKADNPAKVKMLWDHTRSEIIGKWDMFKSDDRGLYVKGALNMGVQRGREAYHLMKQGALTDMSIGFKTKNSEKASMTVDGQTRTVRKITDTELFEISLVAIPANPKANITAVKSYGGSLPTIREFEEALRDAGYSDKQAKTIISKGFRALVNEPDDNHQDGDESTAMAALLRAAISGV